MPPSTAGETPTATAQRGVMLQKIRRQDGWTAALSYLTPLWFGFGPGQKDLSAHHVQEPRENHKRY